nr:NADH-plastoquinone oxidoreductase subunit 4 [Sophora franchetiana]
MEFFSLVNSSCSFANSRGFLNLLISSLRKLGNSVVLHLYMLNKSPSYNLCILLSFCIRLPINSTDRKLLMDQFFGFLLEIRNRWTFYRTYFTDGIYYHFSYFSSSAGYSRIPIIPFPDVSNVLRSNRTLFFSRHFTFFHYVGVRINSCLFTFIHVGGKETFVFSYKISFVHCGKFCFFINGNSRYRFIWFLLTNIKFGNINLSIVSCGARNNILYGISYCFCCQIADYTLPYMVTRHPRRSTLQHLYAFSWSLIKNGSIWIGSNLYGIITPCSFYIFPLVNDIRFLSNNLCSFNISWSTLSKKKNSLFFGISYGFHNYRNWFYKRYGAQWGYFTNNLSWIYRCRSFFLGGNQLLWTTSSLSRRNGWNGYPNTKNIHSFQYLLDGVSCIAGHEWFCCRITSFFWNNYQPKIYFNNKNTNYFCNSNWNDINSYLFIIYVTADVLWIQAFEYTKLLFFGFWAARIIYFDFYPYTRNRYWYLSGFYFLILGLQGCSYSILFFI